MIHFHPDYSGQQTAVARPPGRFRYCEKQSPWFTIPAAVNVCRVFVCFLLILIANVAQGDGNYQRTRDQKTIVWNNSPEPGDVAVWSGARDKEGYAAGYGTLTWYTWKRANLTGSNIPLNKYTIVGRYSGNMVRGKLDGPVMGSNATGKTLHAAFVDGRRVSDWGDEAVAAPEKIKPSEAETTATAENSTATENIQKSTKVSRPPSETSRELEQIRPLAPSSDHSHPLTAREEHAMPAPPAEGPSDETRPESAQKSSAGSMAIATAPTEKPLVKTSEAAKPATNATPKVVVTKRPAPSSASTGNPPSAKSSPIDQSLRSLIAPPASLREQAAGSLPQPVSATPPPAPKVPTPPPGPQLTAAEATSLADIEARTWGYDLGEYQLPTSEYNAAGGRWNVVYEAKEPSGKADSSKHFSVTIDDKTKKAEVTK